MLCNSSKWMRDRERKKDSITTNIKPMIICDRDDVLFFYVKLTIRSHSRPFENIDNLYANSKKNTKRFPYPYNLLCSPYHCGNIFIHSVHCAQILFEHIPYISRISFIWAPHAPYTNSQPVIAQRNCFGYCAIVRFFCHSDNICWRLLCGTSRQKTFETATFHRIFHSQQFI